MEHRFRFKHGDLEIEWSGQRDFVEGLVKAHLPTLLGRTPTPAPEPPAPPEAVPEEPAYRRVAADFRPRRNISLADLITMKSASAPVDLLVCAAYYQEKYMAQETYAAADLAATLDPIPAWDCQVVENVLEAAVARGYMECLKDGRLTLTYSGTGYVRDGLS